MSKNHHQNLRRRLPLAILGLAFAVGPLSACSTVEKGWKSTTGAVTGLFGGKNSKAEPPPQDDQATAEAAAPEAPAPAPTTGGSGLFMGSGSASSAFRSGAAAPGSLSAAPAEAPKPQAKEQPAKKAVEGLVADHAKAQYTEQGGRQEPVTVRPLSDNPASVGTGSGGPPRPDAAPTAPVTRLAEVSPAAATPATEPAAAPRATALAERLGAAPPPAPVSTMPATPMTTPVVASAPMAAAPAAAPMEALGPRVQPLIPSTGKIASYGDGMVVVDGSGVSGVRGILKPQQSVSVPRAAFDPGNASVSIDVGTISFSMGSAALSAQAKVILADVAKFRAQVDGAIRIVGRGDQASARAASISSELRRLGVPSSRLYDGGADSTMLGDKADIYLDY